MRYAVFDKATGRIDRIIVAPVGVASATRSCGYGEDFVSANAGETDASHYVQGYSLVPFPPKPAGRQEWDWASKTWQADLAGAKAQKHAAIEAERDRRICAPVIPYDGKRLDADDESIRRVANKLLAISACEMRGEPMPAQMLVWRDADNVTHVFASQQEYKLWLAGLAVALDARGTAAFAWSWQKKAQLEAASSIAALEAISLSD